MIMCEKCGKNIAQIKTKVIANGIVTEKNYCAQCWSEESDQLTGPFSFEELLKAFVGQGAVPAQSSKSAPVTCPGCGMELKTLRLSGLLGCPECYGAFTQALEPMLTKIHGRSLHAGKVPENGAAGPATGGVKPSKLTQDKEIDMLKARLAEAVSNEEYEQAAVYRDKIKALCEVSSGEGE